MSATPPGDENGDGSRQTENVAAGDSGQTTLPNGNIRPMVSVTSYSPFGRELRVRGYSEKTLFRRKSDDHRTTRTRDTTSQSGERLLQTE